MKYLLIAISLTMTACAGSGGAGGGGGQIPPAAVTPTPPPLIPSPTPSPTPVPTPPPAPTPVPLSYDCTNHPLTGRTLYNSNGGFYLQFKADCSSTFTDAHHVSYGQWLPDSDPNHVVHTVTSTNWPMVLHFAGAYICLPPSAPQTCPNDGWYGDVWVSLDNNNELGVRYR